jgi:hypothetical protein
MRRQGLGCAAARWYRRSQWQRTACPLPSHQPARAAGGNEDKGRRLACIVQSGLVSRRADAGRLAGKT